MRTRRPRAKRERGAVLLALLAVLLLLGGYFAFGALNFAAVRVARDGATNEALQQAKQALIAYAASDTTRPGELPCPDVDNDGVLTLGVDYVGSSCASLIGRLPWRTLNLPDLRDDSGERLWYALSDDFHANGTVPLNSDTAFRAGNTSLTLIGAQSVTNVVALIFAPGAPLLRQGAATAQDRSSAGELNAVNYLDIVNGEDNADGNRVFVSAAKSDIFNDHVLAVSSDDVMWLVERRAAREYAQHLRDHYDAWQNAAAPASTTFVTFRGFYPWAAPLNDPTVMQPGVNGQTNGQLPLSSASVLWNTPGGALATCSGANTAQIQCTGLFVGTLMTVTASVRNVGTAFIDPPTAANVTVSGVVTGQTMTWTLNSAAQTLDFTWSATLVSLATVTVRAPTASAWTAGTWLGQNDWHQNAFYVVSPGYAISGSGSCGGAGPQCVTVSNTAPPNDDKQAVVLMTGRSLSLAGQGVRPLAAPVAATQFLEGANAASGLVLEHNLKTTAFNDLPIVVRP